MNRVWRLALASVVVVGTTTLGEGRAWAACHAFSVSVSSSSVAEGATVTVTVRRDGAVGSSNVDVSTIDETAMAGSDFQALQRTVSFTTDVQQTFTVPVTNDTSAEPAETFRLHLSNPGGCSVNPNFSLGPDARVTVAASDAPPPTTPTTPPTTQPGPSTTTTVRPTTTAPEEPTTASTEAGSTTTEPGSTTTGKASTTTAPDTSDTTAIDGEALGDMEEADGGSGGAGAAAAAIVTVLVVGAGLGFVLYRRRSTPAG